MREVRTVLTVHPYSKHLNKTMFLYDLMNDELEDIWTRFESHLRNEGRTKSRISKLRTMRNNVIRGIGDDFYEADEEELRDFVGRLQRDEFTKQKGGAYAGSTKADIKGFLKQFFKWYDGDGWKMPDKVAWLTRKIPDDEKPDQKRVVSIDETHEIAQSMTKAKYRALIYILFDSGFRSGEIMSVRKKDLIKEPYDGDETVWWIECQESKTLTRKVPIPLFTQEINMFVESGYYRALNAEDELIDVGYRAMLKTIQQHTDEVLGEEITPHHFRHSSATYYAKELEGNLFALCQRYGWVNGSDMAKTYVRRSGAHQKAAAQKVVNNQLSETNERVDELEEENEELRERLSKLEDLMDTVTE